MRGIRRVAIGWVWVALTVGPGVTWTSAQPSDVKAVMQVESAGEPAMDMDFYLGEDRMRMDMSEEMSLISVSGDSPSMYMRTKPTPRSTLNSCSFRRPVPPTKSGRGTFLK